MFNGQIVNKLVQLRKQYDPCRPCDNDKTIVPVRVPLNQPPIRQQVPSRQLQITPSPMVRKLPIRR